MIDTEIRTLDNGLTSYPALSVSPVGLTAYRISCDSQGNSPLKNLGIRPPVEHQEKGFLSKKGQKSIRNAVYWFLYSVDRDLIVKGTAKKKVGFLTLTLQSKQVHSDKEIKAKCLNQFLTELRSEYNVKKYIWKAEKQENGSLHFHILTDTFLPVLEMRKKWNRIIGKLGYVHAYAERMRKLSWVQYKQLRLKEFEKKNKKPTERDLKNIKRAWNKGNAEKWLNPNSIDLESLKKVKNVGAYIGKYMSKEHKKKEMKPEEKNVLSVDGRLWYSSASVSKMKNLQIEAFQPEFPEFIDMVSDAKNEKYLYETDYTITLSKPIDRLYKDGFREIPERFFDYAGDVFNGFSNSDFDKTESENKETETKKRKPEIAKQIAFDYFEDLPKTKNLTDYH